MITNKIITVYIGVFSFFIRGLKNACMLLNIHVIYLHMVLHAAVFSDYQMISVSCMHVSAKYLEISSAYYMQIIDIIR